jgi:TRAP-type mannitol/chloroaromatic compound transport system permease small subunit
MLKRLLSAIDWFNNKAIFFSYALLVILLITLYEVISRYFFNHPTNWVFETTTQLFGFYIIIGAGYVTLKNLQIRVDVFWSKLSRKKQVIMDLGTHLFAYLFVVMLLWYSIKLAWTSIQILEHTDTPFGPPLYPIKISIVVGTLLLLFQLLASTIRDLQFVIKGSKHARN